MKKIAYLVVYNCPLESQFLCEDIDQFQLVQYTENGFDESLINAIVKDTNSDKPIIVIDAAVKLPGYWSQRLLAVLNNNEIELCSALTTELYELSPLAQGDRFKGSVPELDNLIYLIQDEKTTYTDKINPECFIVRNSDALQNHKKSINYACANLLVQSNSHQYIELKDNPEIGNQQPLPAHPLSKLQWQLKKYINRDHSQPSYPILDNKPTILHITMSWGGGVEKWINDYCQHDVDNHHLIFVANGEFFRHRHGENYRLHDGHTQGVVLDQFDLQAPINSTCVTHAEYQNILDFIIAKYHVKQIIVSSLIGHSFQCLQTNVSTMRVFHDYFPSWPSLIANLDKEKITDIDLTLALDQTEKQPFGTIDKELYSQWRSSLHAIYQNQNIKLVAPSQSVVDNLKKIDSESFVNVSVIPHAIKSFKPISYQNKLSGFRVLVLGRINPPKGQELIEEIISQLHGEVRFALIGCGKEGRKYFKTRRVSVTLDFDNKNIRQAIQDVQPDVALITSQTSETFNYTLSELQQAGVCTISTKYGALKDRIIDGKTGYLCDDNADAFVELILHLKDNPDKVTSVRENLYKLKPLSFSECISQYHQLFNLKSQLNTIKKPIGHTGIVENIYAQKLHLTNAERLRFERNYLQTEQSLKERTKWAEDLTTQNKLFEKNIHLERQQVKQIKKKLSSENKRFQNEIGEIKNILKQETARFNGENKQLTERIYELRDAYAESQIHLEQSTNAKNLIELELSSVYQSRSWRMTKPVRQFTTWARHKRNAVKYRISQIKTLPSRTIRSLKARGIGDTLRLVKRKLFNSNNQTSIQTVELTHDFNPIKFKKVKSPLVSVIIPVFNHFEHTYNCLKSLYELTDVATFEILVIDDCSTDETKELIKMVSGISYHRKKENSGFIDSCNKGADFAKGTYLMFLNNDTVVHENWLDSLIHVFNSHDDTGLVGSKLIYPNNQLQEAGGIIFSDASGWNFGKLENPDDPCFNHLREVDYCSGASMLIKKDQFNQLGQFDERYKPAYYEDADLAFAVRESGKKTYYQPASVVTHFEGISSGTDLTKGMKKYQVVNQQNFQQKWSKQLAKQPLSGTDIELCRIHGQPKRVLIFDACTPTPDQDAGSLRMLNIIKIFKQLDYHVVFMPENLSNLSPYTESLQQMSVECIYTPTITNPLNYLKEKGRYFSHVILSRYYVAEPVMPFIREYCPVAQIIFDTVDLHYLRESRMAELKNDKQLMKMAQATRKRELAVAEKCDLTWVVSPYEIEVLEKETPSTRVSILSTIHQVYGRSKNFSQRKDIMFVGSYQHTPNVDAVLWFVNEIFPQIITKIPNIKFHIIGSKAPKKIQQLANDYIVFHGFVEDIQPFFDDIRIAVAPLQYGAGVKGKINSSMSYGQPVIGTHCAVEGMYTQNGVDVLTADSAKDFSDQVIKLYQDETLWNTLSDGGLKNVEQYFSFKAAQDAIKKALEK